MPGRIKAAAAASAQSYAPSMASARELQPTYPYWLAGEAAAPNHALEVRDK